MNVDMTRALKRLHVVQANGLNHTSPGQRPISVNLFKRLPAP